jgi:valyl-tRNA synthetase
MATENEQLPSDHEKPEIQAGAELPRVYDAARAEALFYPWWEESGFFKGDPEAPGEPYCIVIPPPNVTGSLHLGHALDNTLQDILIRFHRMDGFNTVWIPGTDHAGIATQWIVERELAREGRTRQELGRDAFLERVWAWKKEYGSTITHQLRRLGVSCDWSRERFTMDDMLSRAVREAFVRYYEQGLIYRDTRLINWDPVGQTALSDLEVVHEEGVQGEMWSFAYPLWDAEGEIVVATTRPETMLGDTAIAVHPDDERYKHLVGRKVRHPIHGRGIPIVADAILVDPAFGTGAVKVTPAHDPNDYEVGKRHGLEFINLLNPDGTMNAAAGPFAGLDVKACREAVKARLAEMGLERGALPHTMAIGRSQRSGAVVEPMVSTQWFVNMKPLAGPALAAVRHGFTQFVPKQWENFYFPWLKDIKDWCISRQLWWGHRIPAWYCQNCGKVLVAREEPATCSACGGEELKQDPDVLDTWFSSALWPFSTLGWPDDTPELRKWYPTRVLVTAFDIIFFWVARMMYSGIHHMGTIPFHEVCIHGLIRDPEGQKMSKTKGNVVDPLDTIGRYGCDAFRFALAQMSTQGSDIIWDEARVEQARRFVNKLWQSFRFLSMNLDASSPKPEERLALMLGAAEEGALSTYDRWILVRTGQAARRVRDAVALYRFADAANEIQAFVWGEFCDWYVEFSKGVLYGDDADARARTVRNLLRVLGAILRLVHPFMPFLSEEIWQRLLGVDPRAEPLQGTIMREAYPRPEAYPEDETLLDEIACLQEAIAGARRLRADMNLPSRVPLGIVAEAGDLAFLGAHLPALKHLAGIESFEVGPRPEGVNATLVVRGKALYLPVGGVIDVGAELSRLARELEKARADEDFLARKMANPSFVERAPQAVVEETETKLGAARERREKVESVLNAMRAMVGPRAR